jgi:NADH dehydrogenase (ubiquinone) 1 alpha subcomplex subunit 13
MAASELQREKLWTRIHLIPLLQAETDRDNYRREQGIKADEARVMQNVEGWQAGGNVYNTNKFVPRTVVAHVQSSSSSS